ncbi:M16 family metallopeptidase [Candidatus Margulisiibacteriota bacterium]
MVIPESQKIELNNGLKIMTEQLPTMRSVTMGILIGTGSASENRQESGISHFIEHMLFKGTPKRSAFEIAHALDSVGGKINAFTAKEQTMYYAVVLDKHIDLAVDILCDILLNSKFEPKDMELEKKVVLEEIKMYEDTPDELIHDFFSEKILHGHPIAKPTIGFEDSIKAISRERIDGYMEKWYSPQNTIISLAGGIPKDATERIMSYLHGWKGLEPIPKPIEPEITGSINLKRKKTEQVHLCLGVKGPSQTDENRYPYSILDTILGGSMSSHLFQEVREKRGLAYSIFSTVAPFRNFGIAYVYAGTSQKNLQKVIEVILDQFKKLKRQGVTAEELSRAKEYLKGTLVLGMEATSARMSWLARSEFYYNRVMTIDEVFDKVDKITQDDIVRLANHYFRDEHLTLAVIGDMWKLPVKEIHC